MTRQALALALGVGLAGPVSAADNAKPRGSGGGSSGAGVRHHSPSGGSGSSRAPQARGSGSSSSPSGSGLSTAERRHPRAGTGSGYRYSSPYYYYPGWGYWYSPGYWPGYYYGYSPYWGAGLYYGAGGYGYYGGGYGGGYYGAPYRSEHVSDAGALRILVDPEDTKVYVDGYYAGEVDSFDGMFQRLHVSPGRHEITLKKDGYVTHRTRVYVGEDETVKIRHDMERGSGPDTLEDLAGERGLYEDRRPEARDAEDDAAQDRAEDRRPDRYEDRNEGPQTTPAPPLADASGAPGLLALRVTPDDASVYLDGRFFGSARQTGEIELAPGTHRVEIVRPGFRTVDRKVIVESGRLETLAIALERP